jgi:Bacterial DNA polymerase III alpha NTPase domain/Type III restriction enzyme, res subunit/Bacterial DNA polymerase III alpha subunit finger domain
MLRSNQTKAITTSSENDFSSGVHFQATGTGKSWIALHIAMEFHKKYPTSNIMWLCEQKSILQDQFDRDILRERHFDILPQTFLIMNYSEKKPSDWVEHVNSSIYWKKPKLIIINRAFLTSQTKYTRLRLPIHLILHDECHSIQNSTTKSFYEWVVHQTPSPKIIGFSATPQLDFPFDTILSHYSIYDAVQDGVIVPPHISWLSSESISSDLIWKTVEEALPMLPYKKIIVWCGLMEECIREAKLCQSRFPSFLVCIDMSVKTPDFFTYEQFEDASSHAFLFCACKHREGSDISRLDGCIFIDKVENRTSKTFVQCIGRVLRSDPEGKKTKGWILDCCARSAYQMCDRIHSYLSPSLDSFPWNYTFTRYPTHDIHPYTLHHLHMKLDTVHDSVTDELIDTSRSVIISKFQRDMPADLRYHTRLEMELDVLEKRELFPYLLQACQILEWTKNIPHVTRGSCGSSLVCYLLGISHVDPVHYNISFARFTSEMRTSLPDIDFDFPYQLRDEIFLSLELHWPRKVARISNHVYYHDKSATRQAIRDMGMKGFIAKEDMRTFLNNLSPDEKKEFDQRKEKLEDTFRGYMLHCGGITYFAEGVPSDLILKKGKGLLPQITLNKIDVQDDKRFKIDILSSRGLAQLYECNNFQPIPFHVPDDEIDQDTMDMLCRGDNLGITQAESCLMRTALQLIQPRTIEHIAICLAIVRPIAKESRKEDVDEIKEHEWIVFDDDAITMIADILGCSDAEADVYRRYYSKRDKKGMAAFKKRVKSLMNKTVDQEEKIKQLQNLHLYSFCKSHAFSYAQMVYHLAYWKCHDPKRFWTATLNHVDSSYVKWVHLYEAQCAGVDISHYTSNSNDSIYAQCRKKRASSGLSDIQHLRKLGYWNMEGNRFFPDCCLYFKNEQIHFYGVIAARKIIHKKAILYIGVGPQKFVTLRISKWFGKSKTSIIKGYGTGTKDVIDCIYYQLL